MCRPGGGIPSDIGLWASPKASIPAVLPHCNGLARADPEAAGDPNHQCGKIFDEEEDKVWLGQRSAEVNLFGTVDVVGLPWLLCGQATIPLPAKHPCVMMSLFVE